MDGRKVKPVGHDQYARQTYSADACSVRQGDAGLYWKPMAANISTAQKLPDIHCSCRIYNSDAAVQYVAFGADETIAAPTSSLNGIPVLPGTIVVLSSGPNRWIRGSAATLFCHTAQN
jgi:hypothetical protein